MFKRFEVIGPTTLHGARYRSYEAAVARLVRERRDGAPGAYGMVVLPTRTVLHPLATAPEPRPEPVLEVVVEEPPAPEPVFEIVPDLTPAIADVWPRAATA